MLDFESLDFVDVSLEETQKQIDEETRIVQREYEESFSRIQRQLQ